jgi:signal transduction histidine kinase
MLGWVGVARAELLFYEPFDYLVGEELGEYSSSAKWDNDKNQFTIVSGSLSYPGLVPPLGNRVNVETITPSLDSVRTLDGSWPKQTGGTLYFSFILRLHSFAQIGSTGEGLPLITLSDTLKGTELLGVNLLNDKAVRLGVLKYPARNAPPSASAFFTSGLGANLSVDGSTTYLIVAKYEWVEGANNDVVTLWVNPTALGANEDPGNKVSTSVGADGSGGAGRLTLCRGPSVNVDEIRIGQTWADVTPTPQVSQHWRVIVALLACGLLVAGLWITHLRRKVKERSAALQAQILERQKIEQQRLMEQERARIARDLHDELGADITEISMLATRVRNGGDNSDEGQRCLSQLTDKSRQMIAKLEEIVWATDPRHDSLGALVDYFTFFADRFLGLANIKLTFDTSAEATGLTVEARARHQLFLVFKEALANIVKHSHATAVQIAVRIEAGALQISVTDNGTGLGEPDPTAGAHEGLTNMRRRVEKLGGQFTISSAAGQGTTVKYSVPLNP